MVVNSPFEKLGSELGSMEEKSKSLSERSAAALLALKAKRLTEEPLSPEREEYNAFDNDMTLELSLAAKALNDAQIISQSASAEEERARMKAEELARLKAAEDAEKARKREEEDRLRKEAQEALEAERERLRLQAEELARLKAAEDAEKARKREEEDRLRKEAQEALEAEREMLRAESAKLEDEKSKVMQMSLEKVHAAKVELEVNRRKALELEQEALFKERESFRQESERKSLEENQRRRKLEEDEASAKKKAEDEVLAEANRARERHEVDLARLRAIELEKEALALERERLRLEAHQFAENRSREESERLQRQLEADSAKRVSEEEALALKEKELKEREKEDRLEKQALESEAERLRLELEKMTAEADSLRREKREEEESRRKQVEEEAQALKDSESDLLLVEELLKRGEEEGGESASPATAVESVVPPPEQPSLWTAGPLAPERMAMKRRVFEFLLKRSSASTDPSQAAYLSDTVVPAVEENLYEGCEGVREVYLNPTTLKSRIKSVFARQKTTAAAAAAAATASSEEAPPPASPGTVPDEIPSSPTLRALSGAPGGGAVGSYEPASPPPSKKQQQQTTALAGSPRPPSPPTSPVPLETSLTGGPSLVSISTPNSASARLRLAYNQSGEERGDADKTASSGATQQRTTTTTTPSLGKPPPTTPGDGRWGLVPHPGAAPIRHYPAQLGDDGSGIHLCLVLDLRPENPPQLSTLNKWQARRCADCGCTQTTGMFDTRAYYCNYTELLFCGACMSPLSSGGDTAGGGAASTGSPPTSTGPMGHFSRAIPWRIVHNVDDTPYPVCRAAAEYIDSLFDLPIIALTAVAPNTLTRSLPLQRLAALRDKLVDLRTRVVAGSTAILSSAPGGTARSSSSSTSAATATATPQQLPLTATAAAASTTVLYAPEADEEGRVILSEAPTTVDILTNQSTAAAGRLSAASNILNRCLGPKLVFLAEVPELLPLSLITQLAAPRSPLMATIMTRLGKVGVQLSSLAETFESTAEKGVLGELGEDNWHEEEEGEGEGEGGTKQNGYAPVTFTPSASSKKQRPGGQRGRF